MAGVLTELWRARHIRPKFEPQVFPSYRLDRKAIELETAKEILGEVFGTTLVEVEEMIRLRLAEQDAL